MSEDWLIPNAFKPCELCRSPDDCVTLGCAGTAIDCPTCKGLGWVQPTSALGIKRYRLKSESNLAESNLFPKDGGLTDVANASPVGASRPTDATQTALCGPSTPSNSPAICLMCEGTKRNYHNRSWFAADGYYSVACAICGGTGASEWRPTGDLSADGVAFQERVREILSRATPIAPPSERP